MNRFPKVSIVIVNTNELHHLQRLLPSIYEQDYPNYEVLIVDNVSTDGSVEWIERVFPQTRIIRNSENLGYAGANNVGFRNSSGKYVAVLNPDTEVDKAWLKGLISVSEDDPQIGLATPKILHMHEPDKINACGNTITLTGLTFCRGLDEPATAYPDLETVSAVSGAAFVIRRNVIEEIGDFDPNFFIYFEETDLSLRAMLAGYRCVYVPSSTVMHQYTFKFTARKAFWQERNRYFSLLKNLRLPTLLILSPALLIGEMISWGYVVLHGPSHVISKLQSYLWIMTHWRQVLNSRKQVQSIRRVKDRVLIDRFGEHLVFTRTTSAGMARLLSSICDPLLHRIGQFSRWAIKW